MNEKLIESIANAVLYEGYMLYPYRPSAVKNRQRWNFGVLYPKLHSDNQKGNDGWFTQTQCLIRGNESTVVNIKARFLQGVSRQVGKPRGPIAEITAIAEPDLEIVESLEIGNTVLQSWQEAIERDVILPPVRLAALLARPVREMFTFSGARELEPVKDGAGSVVAFVVRTREAIIGRVEISVVECRNEIYKLTVLTSNLTQIENAQFLRREELLLKCLLSAHTVLGVTDGDYVSLIDPPDELRQVASECKNIGSWPALVGKENEKDAMLSSPIILYDYPQVAPESPGNLFDSTEIDEILALRILTLSDDEKREIRQTDDRAREVLERTENMPMEHFLKLHGVLRGMRPADEIGDDVGHKDGR